MDAIVQQEKKQPPSVPDFTEAQRALIKRTVAPDATNDELAMFLHVARVSGLDPLQKQVWFVKRGGRVSIQAGVDGLQSRALEMGDCEGIQSAPVYAKDDFIFNMKTGEVVKHEGNPFADRGPLIGAWGIVIRSKMRPFYALVRFSEYSDQASPLWKSKPAVMIEKVARSTALRRAYPKNFGGIYDPAEMGQAAKPEEEGVLDHPQVLPSHKRETEEFQKAQGFAEPDNTQRAAEAIVEQVEAVTAQAMPEHVKPLFDRILKQADPKGPGGTHTPEQVAYAMKLLGDAADTINLPDKMEAWTAGMVKILTRHFFAGH